MIVHEMHPTRTFERRLELRALLSDWLYNFLSELSSSRRGDRTPGQIRGKVP